MTVLNVTNIAPRPNTSYDPTAGKPYEDLVSNWFNNAGVYTFAPLQHLKRSEMSARQTDLCFSWSKNYVGRMEVKSRYSPPGKTIWSYPSILVGNVKKVVCKVPQIDCLVVVCQRTGQACATRADRKTIAAKWLVRNGSYEVPISAFSHLESVVKYIKSVKTYFEFWELYEASQRANEKAIYNALEDLY